MDDFDDFDEFERFNDMAGLPVRNAPPKAEEPDSLDDIAALNELSDFDIPYYADSVEEQDDEDSEDDANYYDTDDLDDEDNGERKTTKISPEEKIVGLRRPYVRYGRFRRYGRNPDETDIAEAYEDWYEDFQEAISMFDRDELFSSL